MIEEAKTIRHDLVEAKEEGWGWRYCVSQSQTARHLLEESKIDPMMNLF